MHVHRRRGGAHLSKGCCSDGSCRELGKELVNWGPKVSLHKAARLDRRKGLDVVLQLAELAHDGGGQYVGPD